MIKEEIIKAAIEGNENALKSVIANYSQYIHTLAWEGQTYNDELAGEIVTNLMLAVMKFKIK